MKPYPLALSAKSRSQQNMKTLALTVNNQVIIGNLTCLLISGKRFEREYDSLCGLMNCIREGLKSCDDSHDILHA